MSNAEQIAKVALDGHAPLRALIAKRSHPGRLPQGECLPAVVYGRSGNAPVQSINGDTSGLDQVRLRFGCHSKTYTEAKTVAAAVRVALRAVESGFAGDLDSYDDITQTHTVFVDIYVWEHPL